MDKQKLNELIVLHKDRFLNRTVLFPRTLQESIDLYLDQREILVMTGVRPGSNYQQYREFLPKSHIPAFYHLGKVLADIKILTGLHDWHTKP